jgi:hypothetical protein
MNREKSQRTLIVLGMHRSGTSCLAGILEKAGVFFGDVARSSTFNIKGNIENVRIMRLHDDLLRHNGGSWDDPPQEVKWPDNLKAERDRIIQEYDQSSFWGFKDPRVLFTLDAWLEVLPNVSLAGTFRHPRLVVKSLDLRNKFTHSKSISLWKKYNKRLLYYYEKSHFPVISFDLPEAEYKNKINKLSDLLNLDPAGDAFAFYDGDLRHNSDEITDIDLPEDVLEMYEKLNRAAI